MEQKKVRGFGFRGTMLVLYQAIAILTFTVFTNYPMNILSNTGFYPDASTMSLYYTIGALVGIVVQFLLAKVAGKIKNVKWMGAGLGIASIVLALGIMLIPPSSATIWLICLGLESCIATLYFSYALGILVGQWFPRRKGTVMGIATIAFPVGNALVGYGFAEPFFARFGASMGEQMGDKIGALIASGVDPAQAEYIAGASIAQSCAAKTFIPFLIICVIGLLIGIIFLKDYPEQVGAYRDNDKSLTPEIAQNMMAQEIENKKSSVWTPSKTLGSKDFWFMMIPLGLLVMFSVGMMTQTNAVITQFKELDYNIIMLVIAGCGVVGSFILGLLDTKFGTKKAVLIASILAFLSGVLGLIETPVTIVISLCLLGLYMGAQSNFTVSLVAQYWRREDFASVYTVANPIINLFNALGPMLIANLIYVGGVPKTTWIFLASAIAGVIGIVLIAIMKPVGVKTKDDKLRAAAGKVLDDALVGRQ